MKETKDVKSLLIEADSLKRLAFIGILVSTIATITAAICVPMLYSYAQYVQSSLQEELRFCNHRTDTLFGEFRKFESTRPKRQTNGRFIIPAAAGPLSSASFVGDSRRLVRQGAYGGYGAAGNQEHAEAAPQPTATQVPPSQETPSTQAPVAQEAAYGGQQGQASAAPAPSAEVSKDTVHATAYAAKPDAPVVAESHDSGSCCSCKVGPAGPPGIFDFFVFFILT